MSIDGGERIRTGRILIAGLIAGLIMNISEAALHGAVLAEATRTAYAMLNVNIGPMDPMNLVSLIVLTFAQGILMAWLFAALRSRFRSRSMTAVCVGLVVWFLSSVYAALYLHSGFPGIFPNGLVWMPVAWQVFEYPIAMLAGAAICGK